MSGNNDDGEGTAAGGVRAGSSAGGDGTIADDTTTIFVIDQHLVDGTYTGAVSTTTSMPNGKGRLTCDQRVWYEGDWCHGQWTGYGRLAHSNGDLYEGEFLQVNRGRIMERERSD